MAGTEVALLAFNRGRISPLALARTDFKRTALSAETQTNWMPRALGSMSLRPGLKYIGASKSNNQSVTIPFVFSTDDTALIELTNTVMRVWVSDALVSRATVTAAVTNGNFDTDVASWTDLDGGSCTSAWATGGYLSLIGTETASARRRQQVTVNEANTRHALNITIERGPVILRVGSTAGGDEYISETTLLTGYHSLAFTPSGASFYIDFQGFEKAASLVSSVQVASAGTMELTAPWATADLSKIRWDQSGDVVFIACDGYQQRRIERRASDSWSLVVYQSDDGPFMVDNTGPTTLTPSAVSGDITLTASQAYFTSGNVGSLFRITHSGQSQTASLTGADQFSSSIRVTGVDAQRPFSIIITGTWVATITLQQSTDDATWVDATGAGSSHTANTAVSYDDTLDNQVIYYRIGIKTGNYTSGTASVTLSYTNGSQTGICRVTGYTSTTVVSAAVLEDFSATTASSEWAESYWSSRRGYPTSVALYEGRLWWAGKDRIQGSVSDSYSSFDDTTEGDSGPINRSIGRGPVDNINWIVPAQRLLLGAEGAVWSARSTSLDEPLTPTNFNLKEISDQGTAASVNAVKMDTSALFLQRSGIRAFTASYDAGSYDYAALEMSKHVPEIGEPSIVRMAIQRQPETRIHYVRSDGTVALQIFDPAEEINCWVDIETDGDVEDVFVLPGSEEDQVYYTVKRTINGSTVRYHEKWALESDCRGFVEAKLADAFIEYSGAAVTTITGLSTLEGESVVCWGWNTSTPFTNADGTACGRYMGTFTVSSGQITGLSDAVTNAVVGLPYTATYKSAKLAALLDGATTLCDKKLVKRIGVVARWIHASGLEYGPSFTTMDDLPMIEDGVEVDGDDMRVAYDETMFSFEGEWDTDSRVCLRASAPKPCTLLAAVIGMEVEG